ncbi:MAG: 2-hydroxychromene-2-carboxylate isomerase [Rhodospirillales bacterium]|nr:2-hydroxychromene-2-carboxylate isomerase [Rhodospirillales bacterium]
MTKVVDYYFTPPSPWTYLGHTRFVEIAKRHGAKVNVKPVDLGRVFPVSGGLPLGKRPSQRLAYRLVELRRWRDFLALPLNLQPKHFPVPMDPGALLVIAADRKELGALALAGALMRAVWAEERNVSDADTLKTIAREQGRNADMLLAAAAEPETKAIYDAYTQEAIDRGVFGAPTYVYRDEMFWGQDRLDFLDRALAA